MLHDENAKKQAYEVINHIGGLKCPLVGAKKQLALDDLNTVVSSSVPLFFSLLHYPVELKTQSMFSFAEKKL
jgi:hypothetical protein